MTQPLLLKILKFYLLLQWEFRVKVRIFPSFSHFPRFSWWCCAWTWCWINPWTPVNDLGGRGSFVRRQGGGNCSEIQNWGSQTALKCMWDLLQSFPQHVTFPQMSVLSHDKIRSALNPLDLNPLTPWIHEYPWEVREHRRERGCLSWFSWVLLCDTFSINVLINNLIHLPSGTPFPLNIGVSDVLFPSLLLRMLVADNVCLLFRVGFKLKILN